MEHSPFGDIVLDEIFYSGNESVIYRVIGHSDWLIKYQANCDDEIHPLIWDFEFQRLASEGGLAPGALFLSSASRLSGDFMDPKRKYFFSMKQEEWDECISRGSVRYMIVKRSMWQTLHDYRRLYLNGILPFVGGLTVVQELLRTIQRLHENLDIVHGDIHTGNILINIRESLLEMKLIDFGRSKFDNRQLTSDRVNAVGFWKSYMCSPWQIDGRAWARRDDVYKAIHVLGFLINPYLYGKREDAYHSSISYADPIRWMRQGDIFRIAPMPRGYMLLSGLHLFDPLFDVYSYTRARNILDELKSFLTFSVTSMDDINGPIPYDQIIARLETIKRMAL